MLWAFYLSAAVALMATVQTVTGRNPVHALLYLVVSLLAVAVVLFTLGAPFAAALEVIVYAGAIMVLFLFVVMMVTPEKAVLDGDEGTHRNGGSRLRRLDTWAGPAALALVLFVELLWLLAWGLPGGTGPRGVGPKAVGVVLMGPYLLAVELGSMLLLAGLVGAWHLGRPAPRPVPDRAARHPPAGEAGGGGRARPDGGRRAGPGGDGELIA